MDGRLTTRLPHLGYCSKTDIQVTFLSNSPTSCPLEPSHAAAPAGGASEPEREPNEQQYFPGGTRRRSARPRPSASRGRVTRSQTGTRSARTLATNNPVAAPRHRALDKSHRPHTSPSPPTDLSVESAVYPARTWESSAARKPHTPTLTPTLQKTGDRESSSTEGLGDSTAFPTAALHTSPTDNSVDTPQPTPPTDITGDVRHQSARF